MLATLASSCDKVYTGCLMQAEAPDPLGFRILDEHDRQGLTAAQKAAFDQLHAELLAELAADLADEQLTS